MIENGEMECWNNANPPQSPLTKGEELQLVSKFVPGRRVPLFEKEGLGEICTR
jgi:hypothetical protein